MTGPEGFLSRWSRRKREAARAEPERPVKTRDTGTSDGMGGKRDEASLQPERSSRGAEALDLSKLPPIETITAETDIRAFLAAGVPAALRQAALRRAWAADPAIRDFVGLAEYDWDFNATDIPGFDLSAPAGDIKKMVAEVFGEKPTRDFSDANERAQPSENAEQRTEPPQADGHGELNKGSQGRTETATDLALQRAPDKAELAAQSPGDSAMQKDVAPQKENHRPPRRGRGGAMPR